MTWKTVQFGEIASFRNGLNYSRDNWGDGLHVIGVADFQDYTTPKYSKLSQINPEGVVKDEDYLESEDILLVRSNGNRDLIGRSMFIEEPPFPVSYSGFCIRARLKQIDGLVPRFYAYLMRSDIIRKTLAAQGGRANIASLNQGILKRLQVPLPKKDEQQRIADILTAYDDLIENNHRRMALLDEAIHMLYREWFVYMRFPGHERVDMIDGVPEGWCKTQLRDVCKVTMGQSPKSEFYNEEGLGLPFHQGVKDYGSRFVKHRVYCTVENRIAEPGDILFSVRAPVGRLNITKDRIVIGRGLSAIRRLDGRQSFQYYQLKTHFHQEDMIGGGAIFASVTKKNLLDQKMLLPVEYLTEEFERIANDADKQILNLDEQNERLREARDLLLPRLMNGSITV